MRFDGDLVEHITNKHESLETLKKKFDEYQQKQNTVRELLRGLIEKIDNINEFESDKVTETVKDFFQKLDQIKNDISEPKETLGKKIFDIEELKYSESEWVQHIEEIIKGEEKLLEKFEENIKRLDADEARKELTDDYTNVNELVTSFYRYEINQQKIEYSSSFQTIYDNVVSKYNVWINKQIQEAFDSISGDIVKYFNILENNHPYIKNPKIKLLTDKDKAIELEIEFAGEELSPAYKVLSESQINSFGLAVFLSAIKHFNTEFKFIILDDVINSFDGFKRPRVIQLLNQNFSDHQLLVLTHDKLWYEWLIKQFPTWNRLIFYGWDYTTGPKVEVGRNTFEQIIEDLERDRGVEAGQKLGRYLEWILQVLNERIQTPIKYKINNEYTMAELFEPFKKRVKEKLKNNHAVYKMLEQFEVNTIFRNFCMHWKNGQFTSDEIEGIFNSWKDIEEILICKDCKGYIFYDNSTGNIKCKCGNKNLKNQNYYD